MMKSPLVDRATLETLRSVAVQAAHQAAPQILHRFQQTDLTVEGKGDGSPVTIADQEAESTIRDYLQRHCVLGALDILGEEQGLEGAGTPYRWLVDPIDGTRSFIHGIPLFGTIVALEEVNSQEALVGVIHLPVLHTTYAAAKGLGCTVNGVPVRVSTKSDLSTIMIAVGDPAQFSSAGLLQTYTRLQEFCSYLRGYPDCFGHGLVIGGAVGAMMDPALNPWDVTATKVLIKEAGGTVILRPSTVSPKVDVLFGNPQIVSFLSREVHFR